MASEQNHAPDPVEHAVWETLHHLVLEARKANAEHRRELYEVRHRQIDDLMTTWEQERADSPLDALLDRITIAPRVAS
jgi:hypothetical protein